MSKPRQFWCDQSGTLDNGKVLRFEAHQEQPKCWEADKLRSFHLIEFSAYQSAIEELKAAREVLSMAERQGLAHYVECPGADYDDDDDCTCGMIKTLNIVYQTLKRIDKFLKENE